MLPGFGVNENASIYTALTRDVANRFYNDGIHNMTATKRTR